MAFVSFFLILLFSTASKLVGLGFLDVNDSNRTVLKELESIIIEKPIESSKLRKAVADFNALWAYRVGYLLEIEKPSFDKGRGIYLRQSNNLKSKKAGAFSVKIKRRGIFVVARNDEGLSNALYYLAHELLGARWYWPSPLGFEWVGEVPEACEFPSTIIEPSFSMRDLYGADYEYGLRNRLSSGYSFNHNLAKIFNPIYQTIAPDIFARLGGRKVISKGNTGYDPQPNLTNKGAVQLASQVAIDYFKINSSAKSFSISPNDNTLYDTTEATEQVVSPLTYFRRRPNYTNLTFEFANQVANKVFNEAGLWKTDKGEDRYLGMLAYYWSEQSPDVPLHPRILPILTSDRAQWHDPNYRIEDRALIERWAKTSVQKLGAWDYYFGAPYPYPRQFNQWISESIPYLYKNRVDVFFSQLPSMWGLDGPKAWLATQLLWNAHLDSNYLLNEFYDEFFGDASNAIRAFYEIAESHRNKNEGDAKWIKFYLDESGIGLFPKSVIKEMRSQIEEAMSLVESSSRYYKRLVIVSEAFELTELYHAYHSARISLLDYITHEEIKGGIKKVKNLEENKSKYFSRAEELIKNPLHGHFSYFLKLGQTDPIICSIVPIIKENAGIEEAFKKQYEKEFSIGHEWVKARDSFRAQIGNPSLEASFENAKKRDFLGPKIPELKHWQISFRPAEAFKIEPISWNAGRTNGLRITNADMFKLYNLSTLGSERDYILTAKIKSKISPDCRAQLRIDWVDKAGIKFESKRLIQISSGNLNKHLQLEIPLIAPQEAKKAKIQFTLSRQGKDDFIDIQEINLLRRLK